jgi:hypothetical protein
LFYIEAIQHISIQLVPDVKYNGDEEDYKFGLLCERMRKVITEMESMKAFNGNNHKQRPKDIVYSPESVACKIAEKSLFLVDRNCDIEVLNKKRFRQNEKSTISVRYFNNNVTGNFHSEARKLAKTWSHQGNMCQRRCVKGTMKNFGVTLGSGNVQHFAFQPTQHNTKNVNEIHRNLNRIAKTISSRFFPCVEQSIRKCLIENNKTIPYYLGGEEGLCTELTQSQHSLVTECHVDQDYSKSFSIWSVEEGHDEQPPGWYFLFPYLTCIVDGIEYKGIAVKLRHGASIEWDGRVISHCTTGPDDRKVNGIGTFFGVTSI